MNPALPPLLRQAVDHLLEGIARADLRMRAAAISDAYRAGRASGGVVRDRRDATAYALARLPATYAACARAMAETAQRIPDFAPTHLLDAGAGPGGASWAAVETWPSITAATLLDSNPSFLEMAKGLAQAASGPLAEATLRLADLTAASDWPSADLVVVSYALAEIPPARQIATVATLWAACEGVLLLVEPGTTDGWRRILSAREQLIAAGGQVLAPCPHALTCPLTNPDWCHFVQRLPRSRDHRQTKAAQAPFEDEKFSYLAVARPGIAVGPPHARILAPPRYSKPAISLKLCMPQGGLETRAVLRRDKAAYALARRLDWGDSWEEA